MAYKNTAFTLIELIMVITIIGILSVSGAWLMAYFVKDSVYIPQQLNSDMAGHDALDIMIEGDSQTHGLRFSRVISAIPSNNQITFVNQDSQAISYRLDVPTAKLYRAINAGAEVQIPYYASGGVNIAGSGGSLFTYYDSNEVVTAVAANVRRVAVNLIAYTGTGSFQDWEGSSALGSSIGVGKFQ